MHKKPLKISGLICALLVALAAYAFCFSSADLEGDWKFYTLAAGTPAALWERIAATIDVQSDASGDWERSVGDPGSFSEITLSIDGGGFITVNDRADFEGTMSPGRDIIVSTDTRSSGQEVLGIGVKVKEEDVAFSTADLEGTWNIHYLAVGENGSGWQRVIAVIDSEGEASGTWVRSDDTSGGDFAITMSVDEFGIITVDGTDFEGKLSPDKNLFVFNEATAEIVEAEEILLLVLGVGLKAGTGFAASDLEGTWAFHLLQTGGPTAESGKLIMAINDQGHSAVKVPDGWLYFGLIEISDGGRITIVDQRPDFQGTMNLNKNLIVFTDTENEEVGLAAGVKISSEIDDAVIVVPGDNDDPGDGTPIDDNDNDGGPISGTPSSSTCFITTLGDGFIKIGLPHVSSPRPSRGLSWRRPVSVQ